MSTSSLAGKVAIVTGAGSGIGRATTFELAAHGVDRFTLVDVNQDTLAAVADELRGHGAKVEAVVGSVAEPDVVRGYVEQTTTAFGRIDLLHNNAGIEGPVGGLFEFPDDQFDVLAGVNFKGVYLNLRHVVPVMLAQRSGAVVNTASICSFRPFKPFPVYSAIKWAVAGLTKSAGAECAGTGVRVNAVAPGVIDTAIIERVESIGHESRVFGQFTDAVPEGRYGSPEEIAKVVRFLLSDDASYVQGAIFLADGGINTAA